MSIISTVGVPVALIVSGPLEVLVEEIHPPPVQLLLQILNLFDHLDSLEAFIDPLKQVLITSEKLHLRLSKLSDHLLVNVTKRILVVNIIVPIVVGHPFHREIRIRNLLQQCMFDTKGSVEPTVGGRRELRMLSSAELARIHEER